MPMEAEEETEKMLGKEEGGREEESAERQCIPLALSN